MVAVPLLFEERKAHMEAHLLSRRGTATTTISIIATMAATILRMQALAAMGDARRESQGWLPNHTSETTAESKTSTLCLTRIALMRQ